MDTVFDEKEFAAFAMELKNAPQRKAGETFTADTMRKIRRIERRRSMGVWLAMAACVVACCSLSSMTGVLASFRSNGKTALKQNPDGYFTDDSAAPYLQAFAVKALAEDKSATPELEKAVNVLVRTQNAEGGWANASISARNVLALSLAASRGIPNARAAYRKGLKYLRKQGLGEMTAEEFSMQAKDAQQRLAASGNSLAASMVAMSAKL